jgi:hypothetical protein
MSARNGKIARLPRTIRTQLNERLDQSEPSPELLQWLNALPEVQAVVKDHFDGFPISKQNLSQWRQGGFLEWLARSDLAHDAQEVTQLAEEMDDSDGESSYMLQLCSTLCWVPRCFRWNRNAARIVWILDSTPPVALCGRGGYDVRVL